MVTKQKVLHVGGYNHYSNWFPFEVEHVKSVEEADIILFAGGEDVYPKLYGQPINPNTYYDTERDGKELFIYQQAIRLGKKLVGVCRGSQFLCAMAGGILIQHQNNPGAHIMQTLDGLEIKVSSTHHQAQYPFNMNSDDYKILGWTKDMLKFHEGGNREELNPELECEVVYYNKINALAIQPHPEMLMNYDASDIKEGYEDSIKWFRDTLKNFLENKI